MNARYQATFVKPLVNQLIAILQRDQQPALDILNATRPPGRELKPFAAFHKELVSVQNWPAIVLVAQEVSFDANSDADLRTQSVRFVCAMAISGADPEFLAEDTTDYLRAVDMVLTSAPLGDFYTALAIDHRTVPDGLTTPLDSDVSRVLDLRVTRHDLGALVSRRGGSLARGPQIEFVVEMEER
ncbi:MAG: hypothetical protein ACE145_07740 [Terriglobia bacterium]